MTKTQSARKILVAFILNLGFSLFELVGGLFTHSIAILSDSVHDICDALSIGLAFLLEKKSRRSPDNNYTYGYLRYSVIGSLITTLILIIGSVLVITGAVYRLMNPVGVNYDGMIVLAIIGVVINFAAVYFTRDGESLNQKSVNLHMLEDVLGWAVVLVGAILMRFTNISLIDPLLSIGVALFILINALRNFYEIGNLFLEKTPQGISLPEIEEHLLQLDTIKSIHHLHVWSMDGNANYATMHVVTDKPSHELKQKIRDELREHHIAHVTIEMESPSEHCDEESCKIEETSTHHTHSHLHSHHH